MRHTSRQQHWLVIAFDALIAVTTIAGAVVLWRWYREGGGLEPVYISITALFAMLLAVRPWLRRRLAQPQSTPVSPSPLPAATALRQKIRDTFTLEELRGLCSDLHIEYEDLPGDTRSAKALSLVEHCQRHNRLPDLVAYLQREREHVQWLHPELSTPAVTTQTQRIRENLLNNIQTIWIDGFLKPAVEHAPIKLVLSYHWKQPGRPDVAIPPGHSIADIFVRSGRNLLILGEPGSGKTVTLLQLVEALLQEAWQNVTAPVPLILNLSSWAREQQPLADWLVAEMLLQYGVSLDFSRAGIAANQFCYLLDGLDEVAPQAREACLVALNEFKAKHPAEMVICCRTAEYEALREQLHLSSAIQIHPLNTVQIRDYLNRPGVELQAVRHTLTEDSNLQELVQSPLYLRLMTEAYGGLRVEELQPQASPEAHRRRLFERYVQQVFVHRPLPSAVPYTQEQALHWLANLAQRMEQHEQTAFYIERLQPTWLPAAHQGRYGWVDKVVGMLFGGLIMGTFAGLLARLAYGPAVGVLVGLAVGLLAGLFFLAKVEPGEAQIRLVEEFVWHRPSGRALWDAMNEGRIFWLLSLLLLLGLVGIALLSITGRRDGFDTLMLAIIAAALIFGLVFELLIILPVFITTREVQERLRPNQGIRQSGRNGARMALFFGLFGLLVGGAIGRLFVDLTVGLLGGLLIGVLFGLLAYGGLTWLRHYGLRWLLARSGVLPPFSWRDEPFVAYLDAMHQRILLRRVGGGWVFIHRTLQEYFAERAGEEERG